MSTLLIWILATLSLSTSLQHEKSFLVQDGASVITTVAVYQNSILLTSSNDIIQKNIGTGLQQRVFRAHTNQILSFVLTNDSRMITAGWDDMIIVWDLESGSIMKRIWLGSSDTNVQSVSFWNEQVLTGGDDGKIRRVDLTTGRVSRTAGKLKVQFC
jgi:WD40 repeat protein